MYTELGKLPVIVLLICLCTSSEADSDNSASDESKVELGKRSESRTNPDFLKLFLMAIQDQYPNGLQFRRGSIPFRPVRRIGSEFLGKRSSEPQGILGKRRIGSEFLGKRRLGTEFLGKRSEVYTPGFYDSDDERLAPEGNTESILSKRALGSEFLGKRAWNNWPDWSYKRARLGSEFLGKRRLGSEFLGKRSVSLSSEQNFDDTGDLSTN